MLYFCGVNTPLEVRSFDPRIVKSTVSVRFASRAVTSIVREELDSRIITNVVLYLRNLMLRVREFIRDSKIQAISSGF